MKFKINIYKRIKTFQNSDSIDADLLVYYYIILIYNIEQQRIGVFMCTSIIL